MFNSEIIDVAIGLVFVYLLLSLMCSAANELIELWLKNRAADLERGLRELLKDQDGTGLVKGVYEHHLVNGLFKGDYDPALLGTKNRLLGRVNLPSYIPARNFALALMDLVPRVAATKEKAHTEAKKEGEETKSAVEAQSGAAFTTVSPTPPKAPQMVVNMVGTATPEAKIAPSTANETALASSASLATLREAIQNLPGKEVREALTALVDAAGNDAVRARLNIEDWYNSSMDRVSGWYKRRTQVIVLVVSLIVTAAVNADSLSITRRLWSDRALRQSLVAAADAYAKANATASPMPTPSPAPSPPAPCECTGDEQSPECKLKKADCEIKELGLPLGWTPSEDRWPGLHFWTAEFWSNWYIQIRGHGFGWLLTAFAISFGAPFWFDMLSKFIVVRATVKPKEKDTD